MGTESKQANKTTTCINCGEELSSKLARICAWASHIDTSGQSFWLCCICERRLSNYELRTLRSKLGAHNLGLDRTPGTDSILAAIKEVVDE